MDRAKINFTAFSWPPEFLAHSKITLAAHFRFICRERVFIIQSYIVQFDWLLCLQNADPLFIIIHRQPTPMAFSSSPFSGVEFVPEHFDSRQNNQLIVNFQLKQNWNPDRLQDLKLKSGTQMSWEWKKMHIGNAHSKAVNKLQKQRHSIFTHTRFISKRSEGQ